MTSSKLKQSTVKAWKATGRIIPIAKQCIVTKSDTHTREILTDQVFECAVSDRVKFVCANQTEPNCPWGSTFFSYPYLSDFKCRSYKSSFGIWTQAAQNI